jgi:uncharacterized protein YkwD
MHFMRSYLIAFTILFAIPLVSFRPGSLVDDVLTYTNQFRTSKGKKPLELRADLSELARKHSENMASGKTSFGHSGVDKRDSAAFKDVQGANAFAENVAFGATTGKEVVGMWKGSSGHRRNMLGDYKYIGIGVATDKKGVIYYTQVFVN